jgi:Ca2+-binding RTX toxin-like protein
MFTQFIATAASSGAEFVTLEDLADRIRSFEKTSVTSSVSGNVVTATVTSADAGRFALDLDNLGTQVISQVAGWYAYDNDSVFTDRDGGTFVITLGASAADVTHITKLAARSELVSLSGDNTNLNFTLVGEGQVVIDLQNPGGRTLQVTGATIVSQAGDILTIDVGGIGTHTVAVTQKGNVAPVITSNGGGTTAAVSIAENTTAATTVAATDADPGQTLTYMLDGGADAALFTINATSGALAFASAPDFETPRDAGANNVYDVIVKVIDNGAPAASDTQALAITVTNVSGTTYNGTSAADVASGTAEEDTLNGAGGNDTLSGLDGNDTLNGGAGADTMTGGAGNDTYVVDNTGDTTVEVAGGGIDTVKSSITYTLAAEVENLTLTGSNDINGTGNALNNTITGNVSRNLLDGGAGADAMIGGDDNDTYIVDNAGDTTVEASGAGTDTVQSSITYTLAANVENLTLTGSNNINGTGNTLANTITGNSGNNTLDGGAGADTLNGGLEADAMIGGAGNDTYVVDDAGDTTVEVAGGGTDTVQSSITYTLAAEVENLTLTGSGNINGTGNTLNNTITGNGGNNTLDGGTGNDTLNGGAGADTMTGGAGNDTYVVDNTADITVEVAGGGTDTVQSSITYTLAAEVENLTLTGSSNINGTGNTLNNTITGNGGNNTLDGGAGADSMSGGAGNDTYIVDNAGDTTVEASGAGTDTVQSSITYTLAANVENLTLTGSNNINGTGNSLANTITGNSGNNTLNGGTGNDTLTGGSGLDSFLFDSPLGATTNVDRVVDFSTIDDKIFLKQSIFTAAGAPGTLAANAFFIGSGAHDADDRIIYDSGSGALNYDSDGTGAAAATPFATLSTGLALTNTHFQIT